jgi:hypothetical protein
MARPAEEMAALVSLFLFPVRTGAAAQPAFALIAFALDQRRSGHRGLFNAWGPD